MIDKIDKQSSVRAFKKKLSQKGKVLFSKDMKLIKFIEKLDSRKNVLISNKVFAMLSPWNRKMLQAAGKNNFSIKKALLSLKGCYTSYEKFIKIAEESYSLKRFKSFDYERKRKPTKRIKP